MRWLRLTVVLFATLSLGLLLMRAGEGRAPLGSVFELFLRAPDEVFRDSSGWFAFCTDLAPDERCADRRREILKRRDMLQPDFGYFREKGDFIDVSGTVLHPRLRESRDFPIQEGEVEESGSHEFVVWRVDSAREVVAVSNLPYGERPQRIRFFEVRGGRWRDISASVLVPAERLRALMLKRLGREQERVRLYRFEYLPLTERPDIRVIARVYTDRPLVAYTDQPRQGWWDHALLLGRLVWRQGRFSFEPSEE
ncbi:hypothetical protein Mterra_01601 [Calidithermus terrae]|uniref:Uncharacterized protein n=1 Tax=Calidithermus terrae TaxID=1408545 RepID=A0A399EMA2_9DEIN|nr:hypothetical protein [Calidithermus terrae]RIH85844.1 hypothetical protein Mterra_01601 [Calidithermus terrae]